MDRKRNITGVAPATRSTQLKEGALQNGLPEPVAIPNDREELAQKGVILFFQLWCVAERESGLGARHHNAYRENLVGKRCSSYTEHTTQVTLQRLL